jgi:Ca2+-binding EF-hand superfamily protein
MKTFLLASIVTLVSLNVLASTEEKTAHALDVDVDVDKDGLISIDEAKIDSTLSTFFADLDINQDGYLTYLELEVKTQEELTPLNP